MYKITHTGEDIEWVNGPDKGGSINTSLPPEDCGDVLNNSDIYKMVGGACILRGNASDIQNTTALNTAYAIKETEIDLEANVKNCEAELNPQVGVVYTNCEATRLRRINIQSDLNNKVAGDIALTQDEKDEAKAYQKLTEHVGKVYAAADKGTTDLHKLDTVTEVEAFDVETDINWPTWNPPT